MFPAGEALHDAEVTILELADYVYAHTPLKPMSKAIFLISRCLLVAKDHSARNADDLVALYANSREALNGNGPSDDFDFPSVVAECRAHIGTILQAVERVSKLTKGADSLGLLFNTLLRGKCESGEGLGTFLTPEEVVIPMVDMLLTTVGGPDILRSSKRPLYGDICGGTGRFVWAITLILHERGLRKDMLEGRARLFDQSALAVDMGRLNFILSGMKPTFQRVDDSLIDPGLDKLRGRFALLATNPPFGSAKYRWSRELERSLGRPLLAAIGLRGPDDRQDPSELFFFRNLDLLAPGGALAIVLPDGVLHSSSFRAALELYEEERKTKLEVRAIVSLPAVTFSLGGTVAKTSFVVVRKDPPSEAHKLYVGAARHVGFRKRGNQRIPDPAGNDLSSIALQYRDEDVEPCLAQFIGRWREFFTFNSATLLHGQREAAFGPKLSELAVSVRTRCKSEPTFHISILDVDETGLINVTCALENRPVSSGLACEPGDILLSCLNPKIWRVTVVPSIQGIWSCSPEFLVLRPKTGVDTWGLALSLHRPSFAQSVQSLALPSHQTS